jgi:two-component system, NtrC family, response regulator AtoC
MSSDPTQDQIDAGGDLALVVLDERGRRVFPLKTRLVIGRGDDCDIVLSDPSVSRRHCFVLGTQPPTVVDAGSKLGTRLGNRVLRSGDRGALHEGESVWLGGVCLTLGHSTQAAQGSPAPKPKGYVVESPRLAAVLELAALAARSPLPILIHGESGAGKEMVAEYVHQASGRSGELVRVNCAAVAESLLEAELFGYERGAFTGAVAAKAGLFELAHEGTLFLDEIADTSPSLQAKLLRVLENGECTRLGSVTRKHVNVRIVSASHKALEDLCARGAFREDLLYRLAGVKLELPPLRERQEDILPLARRFLAEHAAQGGPAPALGSEAEAWLLAQPWPGNVRELRAAVLRAAIFSRGKPVLSVADFEQGAARVPAKVQAPTAAPATDDERAHIQRALEQAGHNQTRAAEILGMSRRTLVRRLGELGFTRPKKGPAV